MNSQNKIILALPAVALILTTTFANADQKKEIAKPAKASPASAFPSLLTIIRAPLLMRGLYPVGHRLVPGVAPSGAVGTNAKYKEGSNSEWSVELQSNGGELAQAGVALTYPSIVDYSWIILDWAFKKQGADGGFPGTTDAFHGTAMFVESVARSLLLEQQSGDLKYKVIISSHLDKLHNAALWLLKPAVQAKGKESDAPYTHRRWLLAAALGESAELTGDKRLAIAAQQYAQEGLKLQEPGGINPERKSFETSYQGLGVVYAERYATVCHDQKLRDQIKSMITRALQWEQTQVDKSGEIVQARNNSGQPIDYRIIFQAFALGHQLTQNESFEKSAETIALGRRWLPATNYASEAPRPKAR